MLLLLMTFICGNLFLGGSSVIDFSQSSVYIAGTAQNVGPFLTSIRHNVGIISNIFKSSTLMLYSSLDSMNALGDNFENNSIIYVQEAIDGERFDLKPVRLAHGRNRLVNEVRSQMKLKNEPLNSTFLIMMDLDNVNEDPINANVLKDVLSHNDEWDCLSFNRNWYYDIWALRYPRFDANVWSFGADSKRLVRILMKDIKTQLDEFEHPFYPVTSAFNGFAIYKMDFTDSCEYDGKPQEPTGDCEHVSRGPQFHCQKNVIIIKYLSPHIRNLPQFPSQLHRLWYANSKYDVVLAAVVVRWLFTSVWWRSMEPESSSALASSTYQNRNSRGTALGLVGPSPSSSQPQQLWALQCVCKVEGR